ncbi:MAG: exodeoxyribonuclease VII large subunit [Candidatus Midichloria sp.]|nr:MAG: exodeoxyribonuclease VII large subunit [Candidatus Midichloria sp.]
MFYIQANSIKDCFKVSEISIILKQLIEENFFDVRIQGEISGFKVSSAGHSYFNLKDEEAILNAVCWRDTLQNMTIKIKEGIEVICSGKISIYPRRSSYQLIVNKIEIAGCGALLTVLEKRKKALAEEGLFDLGRKKQLPFLPKTIALITSINGAVIRDILHRISDRFPVEVLVWDVPVQGSEASYHIQNAIKGFNGLPLHINGPDIIILARGGGSIEDLWCFNEENVVRAIVASEIPIISAIGHETDFTLSDLAADLRAPTPTAAAEFAVPVLKNLQDYINFSFDKIHKISKSLFEEKALKLAKFYNILLKFENVLKFKGHKLVEYNYKINFFVEKYFDKKKSLLSIISQLLEKYDQKKILERGFAIVYEGQKGYLITSSAQLVPDIEIVVEMHDGYKNAIIKK